MVNAAVLKTVLQKTNLYLSVLCLYFTGAVVQLVRMPPCHGGDSRVRVPSAPQIHSQIDTYFVFMFWVIKRNLVSVNILGFLTGGVSSMVEQMAVNH